MFWDVLTEIHFYRHLYIRYTTHAKMVTQILVVYQTVSLLITIYSLEYPKLFRVILIEQWRDMFHTCDISQNSVYSCSTDSWLSFDTIPNTIATSVSELTSEMSIPQGESVHKYNQNGMYVLEFIWNINKIYINILSKFQHSYDTMLDSVATSVSKLTGMISYNTR